MTGTQEPESVSTKRQRLARLGEAFPQRSFISLGHYLDLEWMEEAYRRTRKSGAVGIDGQTASAYEADLEENLRSLLERVKSGNYRAPPVRRTYIPKGDGKLRPIGIPTLEDKVLQRAVAMVLEPLYEPLFDEGSYGFRPGRSAHHALSRLWSELSAQGGCWVIDLDIKSFFDTLDHGKLRTMLQQRVRDGVLTRLIGKWLNAGVMEAGQLWHSDLGTPQGGVISPLLANIYLHEVLDEWVAREVQPRLQGGVRLVRYADDAVLVLRNRRDAERLMAVLPQRYGRYGLTLHPDKTRLLRFKPAADARERESFQFLGFTHVWGRSRRGRWVIKRKTAKDRFRRTLKRVSQWCQKHRHRRVPEQHAYLSAALRGHFAYFGIRGNAAALGRLRYQAERIWIKWLRRRSQRHRLPWERARELLKRFPLPAARLAPHATIPLASL